MPDATATAPAAQPTTAPFDPEPGAEVAVLFWRPLQMPGGRDAGQWDTIPGRVVHAGAARVCYAPRNPHLPDDWGNEDPWLSGPAPAVRFAARDRCFGDAAAALAAAQSMKPPA